MNAFKRHPVFSAVLSLLVLLALGEIALLVNRHQARQTAFAALALEEQERDAFVASTPSPVEANAAAIEADVARADRAIAALRASLQGRGEAVQALQATPPATRMDAYFEIATFVERMRTQAGRSQVTLGTEERFGFASYANEGPAGPLLAPVIRQRRLMQFLVEALLEARPRSLLSAQRERPLTAAQREARRSPVAQTDAAQAEAAQAEAAEGVERDFFVLADENSVRVPGYVDTEAFRLEFTGQTPSLRAFLNAVASMKLPLFVRSVEVETLADEGEEASGADAVARPVPLVAGTTSRFVVVIECAELVPLPADATRTAAATP